MSQMLKEEARSKKQEARSKKQDFRNCPHLIHLRDTYPAITGQSNDSTIALIRDRGGIPQSF